MSHLFQFQVREFQLVASVDPIDFEFKRGFALFAQNLETKSQRFGVDAGIFADQDPNFSRPMSWIQASLGPGGLQDGIGDAHVVH